MTGRPATRTRGFGTRLVSGRSRVPFPASGTMTFMSHPPVAVFEPHDVVDLGRRSLEQVGRHHRLELMDPQDDLAREHVDRFVLLVVVLQRQDVSRLDVQDLADVAVGPGPDQLVAPGLLDAVGEGGQGRPETRNAEVGTRNSKASSLGRKSSLLFRVPRFPFRVLM